MSTKRPIRTPSAVTADWCGGRDGHQLGRNRLGSVGPQARTGRTTSGHGFSRAGFTATK
jgi:hypothetical protein